MSRFTSSAFAVLLLLAAGLHAPAGAQSVASGGARAPTVRKSTQGSLIAQRLPRVAYRGGPFLRHPRIVTVTFKGDAPKLVARLEQFGARITRTGWWREVTAGYCANGDCIGQGRPGTHARLTEALPTQVRDVDIETLLARLAQAGRFGPLDADTLLLVYLPTGIGLSDAFVPCYCVGGPRAFHRALRLDQLQVAYAVLPRCGDETALTATASHEIVEATTNPDPSARGFAFEQGSANLGFTAAGVEPVDPCGLITLDGHRTRAGAFVVQRAWSNRAAARGHDPCVPARRGRAYVALVPREPLVRLRQEGESATLTLDAATNGAVPAWAVSAVDLTALQEGDQNVEVVLDKSTVAAGETAKLTITLRQRNAKRLCVVGVVSTLGDRSYLWPVAVVMR